MTPQEEMMRAEKARQILEDPFVREALDDIKSTLIEQWRSAPVKDSDLKERLWALYNAAHKFEELMRSHIETGKLASIGEQQRSWREKFGLA